MLNDQQAAVLRETLRSVASDLYEIADHIVGGKEVEWQGKWSTYALDSYAAVFSQLVADKRI